MLVLAAILRAASEKYDWAVLQDRCQLQFLFSVLWNKRLVMFCYIMFTYGLSVFFQ